MRYQATIQIVLIVISLVVIFMVAQPKFEEIRATEAEAAKYDNTIAKVEQYNQALQSLISQAERIPEDDMTALLTYLPTEIDPLRVARDIEIIITEEHSGILNSLSAGDANEPEGNIDEGPIAGVAENPDALPGATVPSDAAEGNIRSSIGSNIDFASQTFEVEFVSTYSEMKAILRDFERNAYPLRLVNFNYEVDEGSDLQTYTVTLETYALGQDLISEDDSI